LSSPDHPLQRGRLAKQECRMSIFAKKNKAKNRRALRMCTASIVMVLAGAWATSASAAAATPAHYVTIVRQIDVSRPASVVWSKVGHFCDLSKWLGKPCDIVAGHDNQVGTIRKIDHQVIEILVGATATSYTYAQPEDPNAQAHFYHGTLDVEPVTAQTSRIVYTLFYDNSPITDPAARKQEYDTRSALFEKAIKTMKTLSESTSK